MAFFETRERYSEPFVCGEAISIDIVLAQEDELIFIVTKDLIVDIIKDLSFSFDRETSFVGIHDQDPKFPGQLSTSFTLFS